jgi:hypothetical protein
MLKLVLNTKSKYYITMSKYSEKLTQAIDIMLEGIKEYDSDTFSASRSDLTHDEVETIATNLILDKFFNKNKCPGSSIDGILLADMLSDIRDKDSNNE